MNGWLVALSRAKEVVEVSLRRRRPGLGTLVIAAAPGCFALELCISAFGQVPQTLNGPPVQVQPYVPEPGVPLLTINPGTVNPFSGVDGSGAGDQTDGGASGSGDGTGARGGTSADATGGDYSSSGSAVGNSAALGTMLAQPWGAAAVENAQALGVNPSALAATCVLESGCQNVGGSGSITGAFQMTSATYTEMINSAVADNPALASQIVPGIAGQSDPATQSIAAAEYLKQGAQSLENAGVADPTVLDTRGYYNFGPKYGVAVATAPDSAPMSQVLAGAPGSVLTNNGIKPGETVGQWRASVAGKIGNAASQSVLT
jgi:hypothetical protein